MGDFHSVTKHDIEQLLTDNQVKISKILSLAMLSAPAIFLFFILFMNAKKEPLIGQSENSEFLQMYVYMVIFLAVAVYSIILVFPKIFLTPSALKKKIFVSNSIDKNTSTVMQLTGLDRSFMIIRYALLEAVALFSATGIFIVLTKSAYQLPENVWYLALPTLIHIVYILYDFPTKDKIIARIEKLLSTIKN